MPTRAIRNVELVAVGRWSASTGPVTITRDDLESILEAHRDGLVDAAPVKLGHRSKLNDELGDGAPAFGWVIPTGIRKGAGGVDTLVGDLVGIPAKLAEVAPTAYRRRSVELAHKVTVRGKAYSAVLTAVSLLGVQAPAVKSLGDVLALYSADDPLNAADKTFLAEMIVHHNQALTMARKVLDAGSNGDVAKLARRIVDAQTREIALMRDYLGEAGIKPTGSAKHMGAATFEGATIGTVELVDGLEGNVTAVAMLTAATKAGASVDVIDALARAAGASDTAAIPTDVPDDVETPPEQQTTTPPTGGPPMPAPRTYDEQQLRELLSLEADADVDAALRQLASVEPAPASPASPVDPATPGVEPALPVVTPASTPTGEPEVPEPVGAEPQLVTLSAGTHAELTELATWARSRRRDEVLDAAVTSGRIAPAERTAFGAMLERDEQGTTTLLSGLSPRFATSELGSDTAPEVEDTAQAKAFDDFEARTFGLNR